VAETLKVAVPPLVVITLGDHRWQRLLQRGEADRNNG
jgi:hypothetical protein